MAKKRSRRQERRRHHQVTQTARRREEQAVVTAAVESAKSAFGALIDAAADPEVAPDAFADQVFKLLADDICAELIAANEFGGERGAEIGELAGDDRGRALLAALAQRLGDERHLTWFLANLAESVGDVAGAEAILVQAMDDL